jgi:hypothetical protein
MQGIQIMNNPAEKSTRPAGIKILMIVISGISLFQIYKLVQTLSNWKSLILLDLSISPLFLVGESLVWVVIGGLLIKGIWKADTWALPGSLIAGLIFAIFRWIKLAWIYNSHILQSRWPINLVYTILGLGIFSTILYLKSSREYFVENRSKIT